MDGAFNQPAWSEAPVANGFIQNDPRKGEPATYDTDVRVVYDDDPQVWGINFERKLRRLNEDSYWSPLPRIYDAQRVSRGCSNCTPARTSV